ncbi:D-alanyl-D-alanine carboxypeptidase family protein [Parvibaculum sp.]|uniref:D-alanyl-D-alanine carboxypeptidase family protein n=1 Tax=Parvibaculum sp. TaxID=2024848 RepID=UPI000C9578F7|nr:D-alanyl-D-alanine carboxypeptidase family protein [Parvibaculum sp.]MAB15360.1 D-alanyl-D-alanine carboxypeptidase [Parvibaculum sp.]
MTLPRHLPSSVTTLCCALFALVLVAAPARAFETSAKYAVLMDYQTGAVLWEKDADTRMHPASMSKLMTLEMLFHALKDGTVKLDDKFTVSEHAWKAGGAASGSSTMFAKVGSKIPVRDLIQGIIVQSGNDACITVAEALKGSESAFAAAATERAKEIGLKNSSFANATGWPNPDHMMTAHDLARLARHIIKDYPEYYHYFAEKVFTWNGITQHNRNPALYLDKTVDGLKTGHTEQSGYGLVVSAKRDGERLIAVLNGMPSQKARAEEGIRVIDWGFRSFKHYKLFAANTPVENAPVFQGNYAKVPLVSTDDIDVIMSPEQRRKMTVKAVYSTPIAAPVKAGQRLGTLRVEAPGLPTREFPLVAGADVGRLGIFGRAMDSLKSMIFSSGDDNTPMPTQPADGQ